MQVTLTASDLKEIATLSNVASKKDGRPILEGIHIRTDGSTITATATDSYQLARITKPATGDTVEIIVPAAYLVRVAKELPTYADKVTLEIEEFNVSARIGDTVLGDRLIDGTYPNTDSLIPNLDNYTPGEVQGHLIALSPQKLAVLAKLAPFSNKRDNTAAKFYVSDSSRPIAATGGDTIYLLMPVRVK